MKSFGSRLLILCIPTAVLCGGTPAQSVADEAQKGEVKAAIALGLRLLPKVSPEERSAMQLELAQAYVRDQELESAFAIFLDALQQAPQIAPSPSATEESRYYNDALTQYLARQGPLAHAAAKDILTDYAPVLVANPTYYLLGFIVAAAYANLQQFDLFFPLFYESYLRYPDHYLAHKTKAILNVNLWQRGRVPIEREQFRIEVVKHVNTAIQSNPTDTSLYKMLIAFSDEQGKPAAVATSLNNILRHHIMVPREEILFFVQSALDNGQRNLAQEFVEAAQEWYAQSRALLKARQLLEAHTQ